MHPYLKEETFFKTKFFFVIDGTQSLVLADDMYQCSKRYPTAQTGSICKLLLLHLLHTHYCYLAANEMSLIFSNNSVGVGKWTNKDNDE